MKWLLIIASVFVYSCSDSKKEAPKKNNSDAAYDDDFDNDDNGFQNQTSGVQVNVSGSVDEYGQLLVQGVGITSSWTFTVQDSSGGQVNITSIQPTVSVQGLNIPSSINSNTATVTFTPTNVNDMQSGSLTVSYEGTDSENQSISSSQSFTWSSGTDQGLYQPPNQKQALMGIILQNATNLFPQTSGFGKFLGGTLGGIGQLMQQGSGYYGNNNQQNPIPQQQP